MDTAPSSEPSVADDIVPLENESTDFVATGASAPPSPPDSQMWQDNRPPSRAMSSISDKMDAFYGNPPSFERSFEDPPFFSQDAITKISRGSPTSSVDAEPDDTRSDYEDTMPGTISGDFDDWNQGTVMISNFDRPAHDWNEGKWESILDTCEQQGEESTVTQIDPGTWADSEDRHVP